MQLSSDVDPYNLDPAVEQALTVYACSRPRFWGRIAKHVDVACLRSKWAQLAFKTAKDVAQELGRGPESTSLILQRLRRLNADGKITSEDIECVDDYLNDDSINSLPTEESVGAELIPIIRRRLERQVALKVAHAYGQRRDLASVLRDAEAIHRIGVVDESTGSTLDDAFRQMAALRNMQRLPTGIPELDEALGGGPGRGQLWCVLGDSADGKSMLLSQMLSEAALLGLHCVYATLELPAPWVWARIIAAMLDMGINDVFEGGAGEQRALQELARLRGQIGPIVVQDFPAKATTPADLRDWVSRCEDDAGRPVDLFVCDYADKLTWRDKSGQMREYEVMLHVYEELRLYVLNGNKWGWTASQSKTRQNLKQILGLNDFADSKHKPRVLDGVITNNVSEDRTEVRIHVAKNRTGETGKIVGPLPTVWSRGMVAPSLRRMRG